MTQIDQKILDQYRKLIESSKSQRQACEILGVPRSTMQNYLKKDLEPVIERRGARIVFYDIETAPSIGVVFGRFKQNLGLDHILSEGGWVISVCYKFAGESRVYKYVLSPEEAVAKDDSRLLAVIYDMFEETDIAVAQNGDGFDLPTIKTRLIKNGYPPLKTVKHVDTLKIAKQLRFNSNKLDNLASEMNIGRKQQHSGISLWVKCMEGDQAALDEMLDYNAHDVVLLEKVYDRLKMFDSKHPNVAHYYDDDETRCGICGSTDLEFTGNKVYTQVSEFSEVRCNGCGSRSRTRQALNSKSKRESILILPKLTG